MEPKMQKIAGRDLTWINIINPGAEEIEYLKDNFAFHKLNLEDAYGNVHSQRAKFDEHENYLFLVLHFPIYDKNTKRVGAAEIDFFIGQNYLITLHNNNLKPMQSFYKLCDEYDDYRFKHLNNGPSSLLYEILDRLLDYCLPMIDHLGENIEIIENNIFAGQEKEMVKDILLIKRNITNFRRIMQSHKSIIKKLIQIDNEFFPQVNMTPYYHNLMDTTKDIWEILNTEKETIDAIYETNESSLSFKLNDIIKTLTIFSVIVFPLTLVAAIFGMNTTWLPFVGQQFDFWIIISLMIILTLIMFVYFKKKNWI